MLVHEGNFSKSSELLDFHWSIIKALILAVFGRFQAWPYQPLEYVLRVRIGLNLGILRSSFLVLQSSTVRTSTKESNKLY